MKITLHDINNKTIDIDGNSITVIEKCKYGSAIAFKVGYKTNDDNEKIGNIVVKEKPAQIDTMLKIQRNQAQFNFS